MYYVYLLKRHDKQETYIGYTSDLKGRIKGHSTKKPDLVYYEAYKHEKDARDREIKLKQRGQSVRRLKDRLKNSLG